MSAIVMASSLHEAIGRTLPFAARSVAARPGLKELEAVHIVVTHGHLIATATDRYRIARARVEAEGKLEALISRTVLRQLLAATKPSRSLDFELTLTREDDETTVTIPGGLISSLTVDSLPVDNYPTARIETLLTAALSAQGDERASGLRLDAKLLQDFCRVGGCVQIITHGVGKPAGVSIGENFVGAIMPLRRDPEVEPEPDLSWAVAS